jgi:hypothetical protein
VVHQEVAREVQTLLQVVLAAQRKGHGFDLEAVEMAARAALHRAGAALLTALLHRCGDHAAAVACACGGQARYHDHRSKTLLTVLGPVELKRAYYVCPCCHPGHSPQDREPDVEGQQSSPGARRMMALVGSETSFDRGRGQLELLAGLEVTAKAVERQAETIGADLAARQQEQMHRAKQLELPEVCAPAAPVLYIEMDGTGIPVVKAETEGRSGKVEGLPAHTREVKLGCVFTQTGRDKEGRPVRDAASTSYVAAQEPPNLPRLCRTPLRFALPAGARRSPDRHPGRRRQSGCSRNTVRKWLRRYRERGKPGLEERSPAPRRIPHMTSPEVEQKALEARDALPCFGARRLTQTFVLPCFTGAVGRILRQAGRSRRRKIPRPPPAAWRPRRCSAGPLACRQSTSRTSAICRLRSNKFVT